MTSIKLWLFMVIYGYNETNYNSSQPTNLWFHYGWELLFVNDYGNYDPYIYSVL